MDGLIMKTTYQTSTVVAVELVYVVLHLIIQFMVVVDCHEN